MSHLTSCNLTLASFAPVPYPFKHGLGLSHYSRLCYTFRVSVLSGGTTGTVKCNCLNVKVFESLQLLKSAYQNGHIGAHLEAEKHTIHLSDIFGTNGDVGSSWKGKGCETDLNWLDSIFFKILYSFSN